MLGVVCMIAKSELLILWKGHKLQAVQNKTARKRRGHKKDEIRG
jgi:hypothetical protein